MKKTIATLTAAAAFFAMGATTAFASTTTQVVVVKHNAYLISQPKLGSHRIVLETRGTDLKKLSGGNRWWDHVEDSHGRSGYITTNSYYTSCTWSSIPTRTTTVNFQPVSIPNTGSFHLPPGVRLDQNIMPVSRTSATRQAKFNAILQIARSKLGTPYIWGHNEDRGQYGFDCSNYVEYVYHHALGYRFSTASRTQYTSVGTPVSNSQMHPGDLLSFNHGGHSGIYIGNGEMIQCGGGLRKVGYLRVSPGSYWYNHISAVKRMF